MSEPTESSFGSQPLPHTGLLGPDTTEGNLQKAQKIYPIAKNDDNQPETSINNRLHREIISLIFQFRVGGQLGWEEALHRFRYPDGYFTPLALGAVCQSWRSIALSMSSLWNHLFILFDDASSEQSQMTQQWLSRSGTLPLTLYMAHKDQHHQRYTPSDSDPSTMEIIHRYADRWAHLFLLGSCEWIHRLCNSGGLLDSLQTLKIKPTKGDIGDLFHHQRVLPPFFGLSLSLIRGSNLNEFIVDVDWSDVTCLELSWLNAKDCINILTKAPRLTHFEIEDFHDQSEGYDSSDFVPIVHHNLSHFKYSSLYSRFPCTKFLAMVTVPGLRQLHCQFIRSLDTDDGPQTVEILTSFFKRSTCSLQNLSLVDSSLIDHDLIRILNAIPSLESLSIVVPFWLDNDPSKLPGPLLDHLGENSAFLPNLRSLTYTFRTPEIPWSRFPGIFGTADGSTLSKGRQRPLEKLEVVSSTIRSAGHAFHNSDSESDNEDIDDVDWDLIDLTTVHSFVKLKDSGITINIHNIFTKQDLLKRSLDLHRVDS